MLEDHVNPLSAVKLLLGKLETVNQPRFAHKCVVMVTWNDPSVICPEFLRQGKNVTVSPFTAENKPPTTPTQSNTP